VKVLVLNPDMTASMDEAPEDYAERLLWLQGKVGGHIEHVTYLKVIESRVPQHRLGCDHHMMFEGCSFKVLGSCSWWMLIQEPDESAGSREGWTNAVIPDPHG
jgi:hypothetical protein